MRTASIYKRGMTFTKYFGLALLYLCFCFALVRSAFALAVLLLRLRLCPLCAPHRFVYNENALLSLSKMPERTP